MDPSLTPILYVSGFLLAALLLYAGASIAAETIGRAAYGLVRKYNPAPSNPDPVIQRYIELGIKQERQEYERLGLRVLFASDFKEALKQELAARRVLNTQGKIVDLTVKLALMIGLEEAMGMLHSNEFKSSVNARFADALAEKEDLDEDNEPDPADFPVVDEPIQGRP